MASSASIAQEFYKLRDEWSKIDKKENWRLAIWVAGYQDVDIINNFLEIERSPIGVFDDIFFRFDTEYKGDAEAFAKALWKEYTEWFEPVSRPEYDVYTALKNDGLLKEPYQPNLALAPTLQNLWQEFIRFKSCITGLEKSNFCIYFPPTRPDGPELGSFFNSVLKTGVPKGIRLVTIDYTASRKIILSAAIPPILTVELKPQLDMLAAINNEMDKGGGSYNTTGVDAQFRKQIRVVMNATVKNNIPLLDKEVSTLLTLSKRMGSISADISGLLIAAQAYFGLKESEKSERYADEAIRKAEKAMAQNDPAGYPTWKSCMMLKGALLMGKKKRMEAIVVYEKMAQTALTQGDAFFAMEGYRLSGHLYYELKKMNTAFETLLLALVAGNYLEIDVRRQSTFLQAAYLALYIGKQIRTAAQIAIVEEGLQGWLGNDWESLLQAEELSGAKAKRKTSLFEFGQ
jgi:hypothetical protein